jgi:hypothetical protein
MKEDLEKKWGISWVVLMLYICMYSSHCG